MRRLARAEHAGCARCSRACRSLSRPTVTTNVDQDTTPGMKKGAMRVVHVPPGKLTLRLPEKDTHVLIQSIRRVYREATARSHSVHAITLWREATRPPIVPGNTQLSADTMIHYCDPVVARMGTTRISSFRRFLLQVHTTNVSTRCVCNENLLHHREGAS